MLSPLPAGLPTQDKLEADYKLWLCGLLPQHFRNTPDRQFAPHHEQFFDWGWNWTPDLPPACLWMVNRGGNKSTSVAGLAVSLGARQKRKYGLVITRTETQGDTHVRRVGSMLLSSNVGKYYPEMAEPDIKQVGKRNVQAAWNRTMLTTGAGWTLQSFSLQASMRGVGLEEYRPDFIWVTDIDDENDSVGMVESLESALSASVLATMSGDCLVIFDQNLIHRGSIINRILTRKSDVLSDRITIGPVPAIQSPSYERRNDRWYVTAGTPTWPGGMPLDECERKINLWGKRTWDLEAQHEINLPYQDAVYGMWDEVHHVITWSEFARYFERQVLRSYVVRDSAGRPRLPDKGKIVMAQDWGNNPNHPCATAWCWRPGEQMGEEIRRDVFFYREMCWPRFPKKDGDEREHPSPMLVGAAIQDVEKPWQEASRVNWRIASHERPEIVRGYLTDLPLTGRPPLIFGQVNTARARAGIVHMQDFLTIDKSKPHPFRVYPEGHPQAGEPLQGKPRVFFIVADGQGELYWDETRGSLMVRPALDESGMARARFEYPNYRKPDTADGAEKKDAPKIDDDVIDCHRAIAGDLFPTIQGLSYDEKVEAIMPAHLKPEVIAALPQVERVAAEQGRYFALHKARKQIGEEPAGNGVYSVKQKYYGR